MTLTLHTKMNVTWIPPSYLWRTYAKWCSGVGTGTRNNKSMIRDSMQNEQFDIISISS